jgi:hypothetical protein
MSREGPCIQTSEGGVLYPFDPRVEDFNLRLVAHSLARLSRFTGHTRPLLPYTVAQHSVVVSLMCDPADAIRALLHDAGEIAFNDVPYPVKQHPAMAFYREAEDRFLDVVFEAFGLSPGLPAGLKEVDRRVTATEGGVLLGGLNPEVWGDYLALYPPYRQDELDGVRLLPVPADEAFDMFVRRYVAVRLSPGHAPDDVERLFRWHAGPRLPEDERCW